MSLAFFVILITLVKQNGTRTILGSSTVEVVEGVAGFDLVIRPLNPGDANNDVDEVPIWKGMARFLRATIP